MYSIPYFKEADREVVLRFMEQHPFAVLIGSHDNRPVATQVPLLLEEKDGKIFLTGHIMKNADHHQALAKNNKALCVFTGPHTYVSAHWYTQPQTASTWNYLSVQASGTLRFVNEEALLHILEKTTALFEGDVASPASFHRLSPAYIARLIAAIVGFEIEVHTIENVFKLSQNRDEPSYENIIQQLDAKGGAARVIAEEMEKRKSKLFKQPE